MLKARQVDLLQDLLSHGIDLVETTQPSYRHLKDDRLSGTHPVCVVDHQRVWIPIVGWICIGVIAQPGQHGSNLSHVLQHICRDVPQPLRQGLCVHWLDHLVRGSLNPAQ